MVALVVGIGLLGSACAGTEAPAARVNGERVEQDATYELLAEQGDPTLVQGQIAGSFNTLAVAQVLTNQIRDLLIERFGTEITVPGPQGPQPDAAKVQAMLQGRDDIVCAIAVMGGDEGAVAAAIAATRDAPAIGQEFAARFPDIQFQELCLLEDQVTSQLPGELGDALVALELGGVSEPISPPEAQGAFLAFLRIEAASLQSMTQVAFSVWAGRQDVWVNSRFGSWDAGLVSVVPPESPRETGEPVDPEADPGLGQILGNEGGQSPGQQAP